MNFVGQGSPDGWRYTAITLTTVVGADGENSVASDDLGWLINPRPSLAPQFHSRASVQPHARPPVSLRPANLLLNTSEWGHEKQISTRGHTSPGCTTVSS